MWGSCAAALLPAPRPACTHRKNEADGYYRQCVSVVWVMACVARGAVVPVGTLAALKPFRATALTSPSQHSATFSGFKGVERQLMLLLLRFTGAKVGARALLLRLRLAGRQRRCGMLPWPPAAPRCTLKPPLKPPQPPPPLRPPPGGQKDDSQGRAHHAAGGSRYRRGHRQSQRRQVRGGAPMDSQPCCA